MKNRKRSTAHIIPHKGKEGVLYFFLQKRQSDAERNPGALSIFGGGSESKETPEETMLRESKEELSFMPTQYAYVGEYSDDFSISHYYTTKVSDNFEKMILVQEGEYGIFISEKNIETEKLLSATNKNILKELAQKIRSKKL